MKKFLGLLTRCRDEAFIEEFCRYYLSQEVDDIYIIDDDSEDKSIYNFSKNIKNINVIYADRFLNVPTLLQNGIKDLNLRDKKNFACPQKIYEKIKNDYQWLIYCDVDEFMATKKNENLTIKQELLKIPNHITCIRVPWVLMSGKDLIKNPQSLLKEILYRHDQDLRHYHHVNKLSCMYEACLTKAIFKPNIYKLLFDHGPLAEISSNISRSVSGISLDKQGLYGTNHIRDVRNKHLESAFFLCYHYRYISEEYALHKIKTNGFYKNDGIILKDLKDSSYPELYDDTMLRKIK